MTENRPTPLIARTDLVAMYSAYPGAIEEEVAQVFATLANDADRVAHNLAVGRIVRLIRTADGQRLLWQNVAKAILDTATKIPSND